MRLNVFLCRSVVGDDVCGWGAGEVGGMMPDSNASLLQLLLVCRLMCVVLLVRFHIFVLRNLIIMYLMEEK